MLLTFRTDLVLTVLNHAERAQLIFRVMDKYLGGVVGLLANLIPFPLIEILSIILFVLILLAKISPYSKKR